MLNKLKEFFKSDFFSIKFNKKDIYFIGFLILGIMFFNAIIVYIDNYAKNYTYIIFPNDKNTKGVIYKQLDNNRTLIIFFDKNVSPVYIDYTHLQPIKVEYHLLQGNKLIFKGSMIADLLHKNKLILSDKEFLKKSDSKLDKNIKDWLKENNVSANK